MNFSCRPLLRINTSTGCIFNVKRYHPYSARETAQAEKLILIRCCSTHHLALVAPTHSFVPRVAKVRIPFSQFELSPLSRQVRKSEFRFGFSRRPKVQAVRGASCLACLAGGLGPGPGQGAKRNCGKGWYGQWIGSFQHLLHPPSSIPPEELDSSRSMHRYSVLFGSICYATRENSRHVNPRE